MAYVGAAVAVEDAEEVLLAGAGQKVRPDGDRVLHLASSAADGGDPVPGQPLRQGRPVGVRARVGAGS